MRKADSRWEFAVWNREPKSGALKQPGRWGVGKVEGVSEGGDICLPVPYSS